MPEKTPRTLVLVFPRGPKIHQGDGRARPRLALDAKLAADFFHPLAHVTQAVGLRNGLSLLKATSVVLDSQGHGFPGHAGLQLHFAGVRMPHHVVERLLYHQKQVMPRLGRNGPLGRTGRQVDPAPDVRRM